VRSTYFGLIQVLGNRWTLRQGHRGGGEPWGDKSVLQFLRNLQRECFLA